MSRIAKEWISTDLGFRQRISVIRFEVSQRLEHLIVLASTVVLAATGLPQQFHDVDLARNLIDAMGGIALVRTVHHFFAVLLILEAIYHILAVLYGLWKKGERIYMMPTWKDLADLQVMLHYFLGKANEKPHFDRFSYIEKLMYWLTAWGVLTMIVTGLMMWFPTQATRYLDGVWIPTAKMTHGWESVLIVLVLAIWHIWHVVVKALNTSIFTGTMSREDVRREHPLDYARLIAEEGILEVTPFTVVKLKKGQPPAEESPHVKKK